MAGPSFQVDTKGADAKLVALAAALKNKQPLFAAIGETIRNRIQVGFKLGRAPDGTAWKPLKMREGQPLRDTGLLQRSITSRPDAEGVTIGTNKIQARVHQFGATIVPVKAKLLAWKPRGSGQWFFAKKVTIPARPYLPLNKDGQPDLPPEWSEAIIRNIRTYLRNASGAS
jgi:phage virion morphogenesis protein